MENRLQGLITQTTQNNTKYPPLQNPWNTGQEKKATYLSKISPNYGLKRDHEGYESWGRFQGNFT